jgi:hypothetical protein
MPPPPAAHESLDLATFCDTAHDQIPSPWTTHASAPPPPARTSLTHSGFHNTFRCVHYSGMRVPHPHHTHTHRLTSSRRSREPGCTLDLPRNYTNADLERFSFSSYQFLPSSSSAAAKASTACVLAAWGIALAWILFIGIVCVRAVLQDLPERENKGKTRRSLMIMARGGGEDPASTGSDYTLLGGSTLAGSTNSRTSYRTSDITLLGSTTHSDFLPTPPLPTTWRHRERSDSVEDDQSEAATPRVGHFRYTHTPATGYAPVQQQAGGKDWIDDLEMLEPRHSSYGC